MKEYPLNVPVPHHFTFAVRDVPNVTVEQRERALKATHYNEFAFPSGMLTVDMLSDSGTTAMTNQQWASLFLGDEAYGRNTGYYVLLDTFRDIFERGGEKNWKKDVYKRQILCCTPSYAAFIGETFQEMGIAPEEISLKAGIFGAEAWSRCV